MIFFFMCYYYIKDLVGYGSQDSGHVWTEDWDWRHGLKIGLDMY